MTTPILEVALARGEADDFTFTIALNSVVVDLTSVSIAMYVARFVGATPFIVKRNTLAGGDDSQISLLDQSGGDRGKCVVHFVHADTIDIDPGLFVFDLWIDDGGEETQAIAPTTFRLKPSVRLTGTP